jgi:hypothetical protein
MRYRLRTLFLFQTLVFVVPILLSASGIVGFHYPRAIDNDPLRSPVYVAHVDATRLVLEDGREFEFANGNHEPAVMSGQFGNRVDLELQPDGTYTVYRQRTGLFICGTPWARPINIPLVPDDIPLNARLPAGTVRPISKAK